MGEILGLDGKPLDRGVEIGGPEEMDDAKLAETLAMRFIGFFCDDVALTKEQEHWVFARLYHLFRRQDLPDQAG